MLKTALILACFLLILANFPLKEKEEEITQVPERHKNSPKLIKLISPRVMDITAYNVGIVAQTDSTPCIGAYNNNLCNLIEQGTRICASNDFKKGQLIYIENYGECLILDRMNKRFSNRIDIAFAKNEYKKAKKWGIQSQNVYLINN